MAQGLTRDTFLEREDSLRREPRRRTNPRESRGSKDPLVARVEKILRPLENVL